MPANTAASRSDRHRDERGESLDGPWSRARRSATSRPRRTGRSSFGERLRITFDKPVEGQSPSLTLSLQATALPAKRFIRKTMTAKQAEEYVGRLLQRRTRRNLLPSSRRESKLEDPPPAWRGIELRTPATRSRLAIPSAKVTFARDKGGRVTGFKIDGDRVHERAVRSSAD